MYNKAGLPNYITTDSDVLNEKDLKEIETLEAKFDAEENCVGLAGPQIGIPKSVIVFAVPDAPDLKKFRVDLSQTMLKTIWLNASYQKIGNETTADWEACFSVPNTAGLVNRYTKIEYTAFDKTGKKISGTAIGFLARVIQHEIDHLNGILFVSKATKTMSLEDYREMRKQKIEAQPITEE